RQARRDARESDRRRLRTARRSRRASRRRRRTDQRMTSRIAITGVGLVTALGATREESWRRMVAGDCGIRPATVFDTEGYRSRVAGEVDIDAVDGGASPLQRRRRSRSDRLGLHAAVAALTASALRDAALDRSRVGVFLGAGTADLLRNEDFYRTWITKGLSRTRRSDLWNHFPNTPVDVIAEQFGFEGPRACVVAACA